ncbi:alpha-amylase family protein [uncultured Lactobacillus sp.]|uniref:alpha-amylase family protein n=1 Tax=uncultured Lactobacillus sp. TaxID=153152 RepID=UPI0025DE5D39|nr:beta-galactosidase trimerization domain-containing protein [uncultured Lactobacillus sp.]
MRKRTVHLDFHTSPYVKVGEKFDSHEFAQTLKKAHVNSITCFARDHHGYLWYNSKNHPEMIHPGLVNHNLLAEQIKACHELGIKVPIYSTCQWDEYCMLNHPEWLCRDPEGNRINMGDEKPNFNDVLCLNSDYRHYLFDHVNDVIDSIGAENIDGFFFDIFFLVPCDCRHCRKEMARLGIDHTIESERVRYCHLMLKEFKREMTSLIHKRVKNATIFYNGSHVGPYIKTSLRYYSHLEIESLPGGNWGYDNFPLVDRYARTLGKDIIGMTGKFHTSWGDFQSFKNKEALEYEVFQMLSFGAGCSIGDQLHPSGQLSPATYELIGHVYKTVEQLEPELENTKPLAEIAVVTPESIWDNGMTLDESLIGANRVLDELGYQFNIIDLEADFSQYKLLILPDKIKATPESFAKLQNYVKNGGKLLLSYQSMDQGAYDENPLTGNLMEGHSFWDRDYIYPNSQIGRNLPQEEHVMYEQGMAVEPISSKVILETREPYFNREGKYYYGHKHAPSTGKKGVPAATQKGNCIYFSHPVFKIYRDYAPWWVKEIISDALNTLLPDRYVVKPEDKPSLSAQLHYSSNENKFLLHLLDYPLKKNAVNLYTIDERTQLINQNFTILVGNRKVKKVELIRQNQKIAFQQNDTKVSFTVPKIDGYEIVKIQC